MASRYLLPAIKIIGISVPITWFWEEWGRTAYGQLFAKLSFQGNPRGLSCIYLPTRELPKTSERRIAESLSQQNAIIGIAQDTGCYVESLGDRFFAPGPCLMD